MSEPMMNQCPVLPLLSAKTRNLVSPRIKSEKPIAFREPAAAEIYQLITGAAERSSFQFEWEGLLEQTVMDWGIGVRERLVDRLVYVNGKLVSGLNSKVKFSGDLKSTLASISARYSNIGELMLASGVNIAATVTAGEVDAYLRLATEGIDFVRSGAPEYQYNIPELFYLRAFKVGLLLSIAAKGAKSKQMSAASGIGFIYSLCAFVQRAAVRKALRALAPVEAPARSLRSVGHA